MYYATGERVMINKGFRIFVCLLAGMAALTGCASKPPSIAHTHIGHSITGWNDTPGKRGLLDVAEMRAQEALQAAQTAAASSNTEDIKNAVWRAIEATDPADAGSAGSDGVIKYGVKNATIEAAHHVKFAADSADASGNVRSSANAIFEHTRAITARSDTIALLGKNIMQISSPDAGQALAAELLKLTRANIEGDDADGDGILGSSAEEYGLKQLRAELQAMIAREQPPYTTVDSWYLFNLVKMPSGIWIFRFPGAGPGGGSGSYQ